jgi:hypothetical protein
VRSLTPPSAGFMGSAKIGSGILEQTILMA